MHYHNPEAADGYCDCGRWVTYRLYDDGTVFGAHRLVDEDGNEECNA